jgi:hypothetical protein
MTWGLRSFISRYFVSNTSIRRCSVAASKPVFSAISRPLLSTPIIRIKDAIGMRQSFNFFVCGE